jgi:hypothetical protein
MTTKARTANPAQRAGGSGNDSRDEITPENFNPRNPRIITTQQAERLKKALVEFGDLGGIIYNRRTKHLVGGHQRVSAFEAAKVSVSIDTRLAKADRTGTTAYGHIEMFGTRYSYREVDWDEHREAAANIAANQHGGEFDWELVADITRDLAVERDLLGFSAEELENLVGKGLESSYVVAPEEPSENFAEGAQFRQNRSAMVEIPCTEKDTENPAFKAELQAICSRRGLTFKIKFR